MTNLIKNPIFWAFVAAIVVTAVLVFNKPKADEKTETNETKK